MPRFCLFSAVLHFQLQVASDCRRDDHQLSPLATRIDEKGILTQEPDAY